MIAFVDGSFVEQASAVVPIADRGFLYADAVFETARLCEGGYFRLQRHLDRLEQSAATLRIPLPARSEIADIAFELAHRNQLRDGSFRITVTRGSGAPGADPFVAATLAPMPADWWDRAARGWRLITARTSTAPPSTVPPALKATGRTWSLLARHEAADAGVDDVVLLNPDGVVAEGPTWNVFWRRSDTLFTPALEVGVLAGVTRTEVIQLADEMGLQVEEGAYVPGELARAEEIFATMTSLGVVPARELDGRVLPEPTAAARLQAAYWQRVAATVERPVGTNRA